MLLLLKCNSYSTTMVENPNPNTKKNFNPPQEPCNEITQSLDELSNLNEERRDITEPSFLQLPTSCENIIASISQVFDISLALPIRLDQTFQD